LTTPATSQAPARTLVCLTPVRNEAWILERFLRAASSWADLIVVLDQGSSDGSLEIAERFPKVALTKYPQATFDEPARRAMLVELGRAAAPGPRILVSLDADEVIAADAWRQQEMRAFLASEPGTVGRMRWINVLPDEPRAWIPPSLTDFMFIDDGSPFRGEPMHGPRLPGYDQRKWVDLVGPKVLHLQYLDWQRMRAKQRWYQALERIEYPRKRPIQIYRQYHHMDAIDAAERHSLADEWFAGYDRDELLAVEPQAAYPTDARVIELVAQCGAARFRRVELWDGGWAARAQALGRPLPQGLAGDPRSRLDRAVFRWLARTQRRSLQRRIRWMQRALRLFGW
jgi:glycosyltransferase involved in cell wall biosynthesis